MGIEAAFDHNDSWITSYRCHCVALARGGSVAGVLGELYGFREGATKGKGGSMVGALPGPPSPPCPALHCRL